MKFCPKCQCETERYKSGDCKPCTRVREAKRQAANPEKNRARSAAWRAANAELVKAKSATYRAANKDKLAAAKAAYYVANAEKIKSRTAAWHAANKEKARANKAAWKAANPEKVRAGNAAYLQSNLDKHRANQHARRARKSASGGKLSIGLAEKLFKLQQGKCACGCSQPLGDNFHLDHIMPLALGGSNTDNNIQLLRARCNVSKGAKHPVEFMQKKGFLL